MRTAEEKLHLGYVETQRPQPHIKVSLYYNGTTYDVHALDIQTLVAQWSQYPTYTEACAAHLRACMFYSSADVSAVSEQRSWK